MKAHIFPFFFFTDLMILLYWTQPEPWSWKPIVQNRFKEIRRLAETHQWAHCDGKGNSADVIRRGITTEIVPSPSAVVVSTGANILPTGGCWKTNVAELFKRFNLSLTFILKALFHNYYFMFSGDRPDLIHFSFITLPLIGNVSDK